MMRSARILGPSLLEIATVPLPTPPANHCLVITFATFVVASCIDVNEDFSCQPLMICCCALPTFAAATGEDTHTALVH